MTPFSSPAVAGTAAEAADWLRFDPLSATSIPLFDSAAIRRLEQAAYATLSPFTLMARAGAAAAAWLSAHAPAGPLLLLAGPGNNGGDALVAATHLHQAGREVQAWLLADPARLPADAARAWQQANDAGVPLQVLVPDAASPQSAPPWPAAAPRFAAVVDGLLGIGLNRPASGALAEWIARLCALAEDGVPVFALDVPSGLSADTGAGTPAVRATRTLTFIAAKPGLLTLDGRDCAGELDIAPLGLDYPPQDAGAAARAVWANTPARFAAALPGRRHASHKGSFGTLAVIGGSIGMVGAPLLGARAALHLGAGRVHIGFLADPAPPFDPAHPELMLHPVDRLRLHEMSALVAGPGMGTGEDAGRWLETALRADTPAVLDADALNLLAADAALAALAKAGTAPRVLTPHPLEAARLMGCTVAEIQRDRLGAARALAAQWQAVVVLKGSGTVIAGGDENAIAINPTGNAGLATAGTGDVLAGMIGALLAQGMAAEPAALAAVWLHGRAADRLVAGGEGPAGLTAGELPRAARHELNALNRLNNPGTRR
ncbi:NAD(P)H-hydrate dehydratase [Cupriavidus gilardii]|uniref:NAD(P)H-hydrate dehydratase n=1 Tax=Cupriavidus gilardii TaxID=82541 RepID=UPI0015811737|nr:NAD(P)H-hydrate dehydratase [Cupriavidus gilardii]MCT9071759.1 NAD(P)H-hydrate dehydratase [Cupriavidus gilardii]QKS63754.1 NAD(P)H-hydrate dehydratase [Cupriavidus gilardii]